MIETGYAETLAAEENLTWNQRINRAKQNGYFNDDDKRIAGSWLVCAVGECSGVLKAVEAHENGADLSTVEDMILVNGLPYGIETACPEDVILADKGMEFYYAVSNNNVSGAVRLRKDIRARYKELGINCR